MKKNFSFNKFRIKDKKNQLFFFDAFDDNKKINNIIRFKSFLKTNEIKLPKININKNKKPTQLYMSKYISKQFISNNIQTHKYFKTEIKNNSNSNNNYLLYKKKQNTIPINKANNQCQNINQNFIININNNSINNSYQIKLNDNEKLINQKKHKNCNYNFSKIKIINREDNHNINKNLNASRNNYSELSDLSCFNSNKKTPTLNSINSFVNNNNDIFSISEEANLQNNCDINSFDKTNDKNILNENKKILINQVEFEKFCKEVNEILQC